MFIEQLLILEKSYTKNEKQEVRVYNNAIDVLRNKIKET